MMVNEPGVSIKSCYQRMMIGDKRGPARPVLCVLRAVCCLPQPEASEDEEPGVNPLLSQTTWRVT